MTGRLAFLYPGQGSQRAGMGADLRKGEPELFERHLGLAEECSGLPLRRLCVDGRLDELTRTEVSQPALFALSMAATELARAEGLEPDLVAGHSLGEFAAAVACGALDLEDGMRLVVTRSRLMAAVQREHPGAMAAVIGVPAAAVAGLCDAAGIAVANFNAPEQTVVSGSAEGVARLCRLAEDRGARAIRLPVGGAFHSPAMAPVRDALERATASVDWRPVRVPLAANVSGALVTAPDELRAALVAQVCAPVRWIDCVRSLAAAGCTRGLELGPGRVVAGLVRLVDPSIDVAAGGSRRRLATFAAARAA